MSANIPFDIQREIIKRILSVKSLIRFRSVSKQWKSLIDNSEFIKDHSVNQSHQNHLLVSYLADCGYNYVSIVDDDSFPQHKFSPTVPAIVKLVRSPFMLGCSHGLVCLFQPPSPKLIVVWNPSIRKSVGITLHDEPLALGFGVCPKTFDPKIVKVTRTSEIAEIFTLSSRVWRSITMNLSHKPKNFSNYAVTVDGLIHWIGIDLIKKNDEKTYVYRIITFDLTSEEFDEANLPDCLAGYRYLAISKLRESLVVLDYGSGDAVCDVWIMLKNGVKKCTFTKLYSVKAEPYSVIGFMKNGHLVIRKIKGSSSYHSELHVYEPRSGHMNDLGIDSSSGINMASYTESLLLLDHSDSIITSTNTKNKQP